MKDAFGKPLEIGSKVIYSTGGSAGTSYVVGEITELIPCVPKKNASYYPPDRVRIKPTQATNKFFVKNAKDPVLYASNVVAIETLK